MNKPLVIGIIVIVVGILVLGGVLLWQMQSSESTPQSNEQEVVPEETVQTETSVNEVKKDVCFDDYRETPYQIAATANTTGWQQFDTDIAGFAFRYPDNVSASQNEISARRDSHKATIATYNLRQGYVAPYIHASPVIYEPLSNTWWKYPSLYVQGQNPSDAKECMPNPIGHTTKENFPIYLTVDGDVGVSVYTYFVVIKDVVQSDNYTPIIVEFRTVVDGNSSNASTFGEFQDILENIIRSVEVRPTSKG